WNNSNAIPAERAPKMGTIVHRAVRHAESGSGQGALEVTADWVDAQGKALLREDTRFVFRAAAGSRTIDRITTLTAVNGPVTFIDNKEGLIGMRVARALEQPSTTPEVFTDAGGHSTTVPRLDNTGVTGHYRSSEGVEGDSVWGTRGRWTMLTGVVAGEPVTLAMLDHPKNVGFPTYWHARGYGILAPTLQRELHWSETGYGDVVSWFTALYAVGFLVVGRWLDRVGVRRGFAVAVVAWSVAAMGHAVARTTAGFAAARALLGLGESANFPGAIKAVAEWFPKNE